MCSSRRTQICVVTLFFLFFSASIAAQEDSLRFQDPFPTDRWCSDSGTACWRSPDRGPPIANGIRIIADVDLRILLQRGHNRFELQGFSRLSKLAVEVNLYKSWVAFQVALRGPGAIAFDERSEALSLLPTGTRDIPTDWGLSYGLSFFDSSIALVWGRLHYDDRYFRVPTCQTGFAEETERQRRDQNRLRPDTAFARNCVMRTELRDSYWYVAFQPVSGLRSAIKQRPPARSNSEAGLLSTTQGSVP